MFGKVSVATALAVLGVVQDLYGPGFLPEAHALQRRTEDSEASEGEKNNSNAAGGRDTGTF